VKRAFTKPATTCAAQVVLKRPTDRIKAMIEGLAG